jgi:hypothetical protein
MIITGLALILQGVFNYAPGALRVITVYVVWPIVFTVLIAGVTSEGMVAGLLRTLVIAALAIDLYSLSYVSFSLGWLPDLLYVPLDQGQAIGFYQGYVQYNLYSLATLLFLIPFVVAGLLTWPGRSRTVVSRFWLWTALILGLILVLLSGRRALLVVAGLSPFITLIFRSFLPRPQKLQLRGDLKRFFVWVTLVLSALILFLRLTYGFNVASLVEFFGRGFEPMADVGAFVRREQFLALLSAWADSPLIGAGHGASAAGLIRSEELPWSYELYYLALLFQG